MNEKILMVAMVKPGETPTPELVQEAKRVETLLPFLDELIDAVDGLVASHMRVSTTERVAATVQKAIDLQLRMAEKFKVAA